MSTMLLLGFTEKQIVSGDLLKLRDRFGADLNFKSVYPATPKIYESLCDKPDVIGVLVNETKSCLRPTHEIVRNFKHYTFYDAYVGGVRHRILHKITSSSFGMLPEPILTRKSAA